MERRNIPKPNYFRKFFLSVISGLENGVNVNNGCEDVGVIRISSEVACTMVYNVGARRVFVNIGPAF